MHRIPLAALLLLAVVSAAAAPNPAPVNLDFESGTPAVPIEAVARPPLRSGRARAVTPRGLENLVAFTRLLGIVRHFHPSDQAAAADWDAVAVNGIDQVESAKDAHELAARLADVFLPLAPSLLIYPASAPPKGKSARPGAATAVVAWEHTGFGHKQATRFPYTSERVRRAVDETPLQPHRIDLGGGVSASVPLAVYADGARTLPRPTRQARAYPVTTYTGNDRATRLGGVVLLWNVIQHFYPYFDVVEVDWPAELKIALRAAATDAGERAFLQTLRRLVAAIDDGHGSVSHPTQQGRGSVPLLWRVVGNALVVTTVGPAVRGVNVGDVVVTVDGKPALEALREIEALVSAATPQWRRAVALNELGTGPAGTTVSLTLRGAGGTTRQVALPRIRAREPLREKRPEKIAELKPGLWYVDLGRATDADLKRALGKLAAARGIVFDLRGYPRVGSEILRHLIDAPSQSARWLIPRPRRPDRKDVEWLARGRWNLQPGRPSLPKNRVFLTDGRAISYAESWMGIIEAYELAEIVGETTAGTNGNTNSFTLPGGYRIVFTGMKVLKHDGSRHHGVGIAPTVPVSPTLEGIRAGRDEQLEKAIAILERNAAVAAAEQGASRSRAGGATPAVR